MKKILIFVLLDVIILVGLYFGAPTLKELEPISGPVGAYEDFVNGIIGIQKEEPIVEVEAEAEPEEEPNPKPTDDEEEPEEEVIKDEVIPEEEEEPVETGPKPAIIDLSFYSDDKINFTYPKEFVIVEVTDSTFEMQTEQGNLLATFDIFENKSNLALAEFLKQDNIVDYLDEADRVSIKAETLAVAEEAIYLKDFPGFITQDVYLVRIPGFVFLIQARNQKDLVRKYVVPTLEAK